MSTVTTFYRFVVKRDTAANFTSANTLLLSGEYGLETDKRRLKIGDGVTAWNSLPYLNSLGTHFQYLSDTGSIADSDPGAGLFKWNNATQSSATFIYFDDATTDTGTDLSNYFATLASNSPTGILHLANTAGDFQIFKWTAITDGTGYFKFAVIHQVSSASFADNIPAHVAFYPLGSGSGGAGAMTLVSTATVSGSAATTLTMSGLDLNTDKSYYVEYAIANATASGANLSLFYSGDTTATNYYRSSNFGASTNDAFMGSLDVSSFTTGFIRIVMGRDSKAKAVIDNMRYTTAPAVATQYGNHAYKTAANVTSITISSSVANSLAIGSYFKVWKVQ